INSIQIDESFIDFYEIAKEKNKKIIILSDGFDIFIKTVLKKYGVNVPIWANTLEIKEENGYLKFKNLHPNYKQNCKIGSGCCKCGVARKYAKDYIYIGDGLSDRCIAKHASLLFAKNSLEIFCKKENVSYFPYKTFQDIINAANKENFNAANGVSINNG
ncbi:MAG: HAD-IB family phosphatase, partial [Candidatus Gastranaerophilales bacterium]|nr:HAD-IB family phosphatase [Candidatus Gastranaerophilales bacterium]